MSEVLKRNMEDGGQQVTGEQKTVNGQQASGIQNTASGQQASSMQNTSSELQFSGEQRMYNVQYAENMPQQKRTLYDTHVKENFQHFGIASLIYACLYAFCMYKNDAGITYPVFVVGTVVFIRFCLKKLDIKMKKESIFYIVSMVLLSVSTFCTDDGRIIFFNKTGVFLLTICLLLGIIYDTKQWNLGKYLGSVCKVCVMSVGELGHPVSDAVWYCKNKLDKKNSRYLYVLMGIGITIPLFIIVFLLLSSADAVFRDLADRLFSGLELYDLFLIALMAGFMFFASYCILTFLCKKTIQEEVADSRRWEPLIAVPAASIMSVLYLVFSGIQIVYLFMGNMQLPDGYTYAEYAREGFFQLLAVSILNLVMVLVGLYYFKPSRVLKAVLTIMSLCTFVMIASSALRMIIYIQYYYLTFLRILVLWSLVVLFLVFAGVVVYIVKEDFPLFRYSMVVFTCLYTALSFSHPDYWIAKVNLASTQENRSSFFKGEAYEDYYFLSTLNADAAQVMMEWMVEEGYPVAKYYYMEDAEYTGGGEVPENVGDTLDSKFPEDTEYMGGGEVSEDAGHGSDSEVSVDMDAANDADHVENADTMENTDYEEDVETGENREHVVDKAFYAYLYMRNLRENTEDVGIRNFNVSRFFARLEVLFWSMQGM